jgi:hypothetical protein
MNKPEWKDAPEWAVWLAQDKDGWFSWWNMKPETCNIANCWNQDKGRKGYKYLDICVGELPVDWTDTLELRP